MAQLALNIVIGRLQAAKGPFADRLALLRNVVRDTLADVEELVRAEAVALGVAEAELEEHVGVAVGLVVRRAAEGALEDARKARTAAQAERRGGPGVTPAAP